MILDAESLDATSCYKILIGTVLPRAIGWVSTLSSGGVANLAPFSFFTVVCRKPPMVSLTIQPRSDRVTLKDTLVNIMDTGEFVTNLVSLPHADAMHHSSVEHASEVDEFDAAKLAKAPSAVGASTPGRRRPGEHGVPARAHHPARRRRRPRGVRARGPLPPAGRSVAAGRRVDTAALQPVGRLAAEYTFIDSVFTSPLDPRVVENRASKRMVRLDAKPAGWSPIDEAGWTGAGNAIPD